MWGACEMNVNEIKFDEKGLVPAIVQDARSRQVLTLAYMNEESLTKSIETGETYFFSRSRQELWHKGETSGNTQAIHSIRYDCDQDAILVEVIPAGPACHKGDYSCFSSHLFKSNSPLKKDRYEMIEKLTTVLSERKAMLPEGSYATSLFEGGIDRIGKKIGEEAAEVIIAAKNNDLKELTWESADLFFHLLVLITECGLPFEEVLDHLEARQKN